MKNIINLYSRDENLRLNKKIKIWKAIFFAFVFMSLVACVVLVCLTNTRNVMTMQIAVLTISAVCGCAAIFMYVFGISEPRRRYDHAERLINDGGEEERFCGDFTVSKYIVRIKNSVTVRHVKVFDGTTERKLNIDVEKTDLLPKDNGKYVFYTVHRYIVRIEGENEDV